VQTQENDAQRRQKAYLYSVHPRIPTYDIDTDHDDEFDDVEDDSEGN